MGAIGNKTGVRNQAIDQGRFFAAFLVILVHAPIPGMFGAAVGSVARLAVPFFFMVSGYYACWQERRALVKRAGKTLKIFFVSICMYLVWELFLAATRGYAGEMLSKWFSWKSAFEAFVLNVGVIKHLWFLLALAYCYLIYLLFVNTTAVVKLLVAVLLLCGFFVATRIGLAEGLSDPCYYSRNFLLDGLPHFLLGSIVRQERDRLFNVKPWVLWTILLTGVAASIAERLLLAKETDLYFGTSIGCLALFILHASNRFPSAAGLSKLGKKYSRDVYIIHMLIIAIMNIAVSIFSALIKIPNLMHNTVFLSIKAVLVFVCSMIVVVALDKISSIAKKKA